MWRPTRTTPWAFGLKPAALLHYGPATLGVLIVLVVGFFMARQAGRGAAKTA